MCTDNSFQDTKIGGKILQEEKHRRNNLLRILLILWNHFNSSANYYCVDYIKSYRNEMCFATQLHSQSERSHTMHRDLQQWIRHILVRSGSGEEDRLGLHTFAGKTLNCISILNCQFPILSRDWNTCPECLLIFDADSPKSSSVIHRQLKLKPPFPWMNL